MGGQQDTLRVSDMVSQPLDIKVIREVAAQAPEEHTQPWNIMEAKCNLEHCSGSLGCLFYGSHVYLSSWSDGVDERLSHDFWVLCQESFIQIRLPLALVAVVNLG